MPTPLSSSQTQGATLEEVMANTGEAIELYLETMDDEERRRGLSREILTTSLEVNIAYTTTFDGGGGGKGPA